MQVRRTIGSQAPVLLVDPELESAAGLATHLELNGFPTHIENTGAGAQAAIKNATFATLIVIADLHDKACLDWLDELRRAAARSWMVVVSSSCDRKTCNLIYRHGGDACIATPVSIDDLTRRLTAFQSRARPLFL
jgi:DNA-binding response OmpR family regulator